MGYGIAKESYGPDALMEFLEKLEFQLLSEGIILKCKPVKCGTPLCANITALISILNHTTLSRTQLKEELVS